MFFFDIVIPGQVFLKDTDERACAYIAGPAPNRWGLTVDGDDLFESVSKLPVTGKLHRTRTDRNLGLIWCHNFHACTMKLQMDF